MSLRRTAGRWGASLLVAVPLAATAAVVGGAPTFDHRAAAPASVLPAGRADDPGARTSYDVLALGDSVPSGRACNCRPFPVLYAGLLSRRTGARVTEQNRAVSGLDTGGLVSQLRDPSLANAVRRADIVLVTIGANDFGDHHDQVVNGECGTGTTDCVRGELRSMGDHLTAVLAMIRALRAGQATTVLVTGYWNVFEDGDVARRAFGSSGLRGALRLTRRANGVIRSATAAAGAAYVDIFRPFERSRRDITSLLAADGDHPDAAGHELIARALLRAGLPRMR